MSKHTPKRYRPEDKKPKSRKKIAIIFASLCLACAIGVGSTVAFITTSTGTVENTFIATDVQCAVQETFANNVKTDVKIQNTGKIDAFIRADVIVTWQNAEGEIYGGAVPVDDQDYTITWYNESDAIVDNWIAGNDGFYYYNAAVAPNDFTTVLFTDCKLKDGVTPPEGYSLNVEIVASAIQAQPETVVETQWDNTQIVIDANGKTLTVTEQTGG